MKNTIKTISQYERPVLKSAEFGTEFGFAASFPSLLGIGLNSMTITNSEW